MANSSIAAIVALTMLTSPTVAADVHNDAAYASYMQESVVGSEVLYEKGEFEKADLSMWTSDSYAAAQLKYYVESVTDIKSADYIPPENRIAVFDFDGTLFCETDPNYFDYCLLE